MKIVLDTNVVVSGVFFGGVPGRILSAWSAGKLAVVLSPSILEEYRRVGNELGRQHADVSETFEPLLALLAMHAMIVDAPPLPEPARLTRLSRHAQASRSAVLGRRAGSL